MKSPPETFLNLAASQVTFDAFPDMNAACGEQALGAVTPLTNDLKERVAGTWVSDHRAGRSIRCLLPFPLLFAVTPGGSI
jgi:hypothetical protein